MPELIKDPNRARTLARAIVSDILMYNPDKIKQGIENDSLFDTLEEEIEEGRELFRTRVDPGLHNTNLYDLAVVDVLFKNTGKYESKIW